MKRITVLVLAGLLALASPAIALAQLSPGDFVDIRGHWAEQEIQTVCERGLMHGTGTNAQGLRSFTPNGLVTRSQAAAVLERIFQLDYGQIGFIKAPLASDYYRDVNDKAWYAEAALVCAINNIFEDGDHFYPNQPVTRLELAGAIKRCFDAKGISIPMIMMMPIYEDTDNLSPADLNVIAFVTNTGIMKGDSGYFRPGDTLKRAELAAIINRCARLTEVNENYDGQEYRLSSGQTLVLSLASNPSTGYQWSFVSPYDEKVLVKVDEYYQPDQNRSIERDAEATLVGQGGRSYWKFKAEQAGTTELRLAYARPGEEKVPAHTFAVKVIVAPSTGLQSGVTIKTKEIKSQSESMSVDLAIPVLEGLEDTKLQTAINARWETEAKEFQEEVAVGLEDYVNECKKQGYPIRQYQALTRYQLCDDSHGVLSLYIDYYQYTGGAHGLTTRKGYNIDLNTGKELALKELFPENSGYKEVINAAIKKQISANPEDYYSQPEMGGFTSIADDQGYYIQNGGLVVYFGQYEIAPYAAGIPEFKIPFSRNFLPILYQQPDKQLAGQLI